MKFWAGRDLFERIGADTTTTDDRSTFTNDSQMDSDVLLLWGSNSVPGMVGDDGGLKCVCSSYGASRLAFLVSLDSGNGRIRGRIDVEAPATSAFLALCVVRLLLHPAYVSS
jgi:hypothetical protein